jgi:hypothetical protein
MRFRFAILPIATLACATPPDAGRHSRDGWNAPDTATVRRLAATAAELELAGGSLRVVNLYKLQAEALSATAGAPRDSTIARLVRDVYAPYSRFWAGYLGDEAEFRRWTVTLLEPEHPIHERLEPLLDVALDRRFTEGVEWLERTTGRRPVGTWHIVFGPGWTDMGGLGDIGMVADFTRMRPDSAAIANLLPHELTHQVHGSAAGRAADPDAGSVLERIISEGFASYVSWVYGDGRRTEAQALGYSPDEWAWSVAHERELFDAVQPILSSRERDDTDRVAARREQLIDDAPGAAGYFIGLRIVQSYVARNGPDAWKDIYDLPVRQVLAGSGYVEGLPDR